jgi:ABC-type lipoprotein release transport system permease subunit
MIWKTAWKNVWRNRVRSIVVISSVTVGVFAAVFMMAFMNGMIAQRVDAALDEEISHIQITEKGFRLNNDPGIVISGRDSIISVLGSEPGIAGFVERKIISAMAGTASRNAGVQIIGINPEEEKEIFTLNETIIPGTGDFFESESKSEMALIGQDLAKTLNIIRYSIDSTVIDKLREKAIPEEVLSSVSVLSGIRFRNEKKFISSVNALLSMKEISRYGQIIKNEAWSYRQGSRITFTLLDRDNIQVGARFRVAGIYDLKNTMFEQGIVFVRNSDLSRLSGLDTETCHQFIVRINDTGQTEAITKSLRKKLPGVEIMNWKEIQPDLAMMTDYTIQMYAIFMGIILAALAFGIVNTMLMVVLERTRELGMLTAIGMNSRKVFTMIMLESVFLSVIGGIAGMFVAWGTILLTAKKGINFAEYAEGMEAYGYSAHVYPEIGTAIFVMAAAMIIITGILASVYPAIKALQLNPVEAIRTE